MKQEAPRQGHESPQESSGDQSQQHVNPWHVAVDRAACVGSGQCVAAMPGAFVLVDDWAQVVSSRLTADELLLMVAQNCPASAITIVDAVTGSTLFPDDDSEN